MLFWLWRTLRDGFRSWLRRDAIRSSPTDRLWLSIQPPCILLWQGERIEVVSRQELPSEAGSILQFGCLTPRGRETLVVHPGGLHQNPRWEWVPGSAARGQRLGKSHVADSVLP